MAEELTDAELTFLHGLFDHARAGRTARLREALERGVPVDLTDSKGDTLLILAAYHEHPETVRMLLELGADTARLNDRGQTALVAAVFRKQAEAVTALLDAGADPRAGRRSALEVAAFFEADELVALLERAVSRP